MKHRILLILAVLPLAAAHAGGSNYGITPGALPNLGHATAPAVSINR
jgi:hypothetical protein